MVVWLWPVSEPCLAECPVSRHWGQDLVFTVSGAEACNASAGLEAQCAGLVWLGLRWALVPAQVMALCAVGRVLDVPG